MKIVITALALLLLSSATLAGNQGDIIETMSNNEKRTIFKKLLNVGGRKCDTVTTVFWKTEDGDQQDYYVVLCNNARYMVGLPNDMNANSRILKCSVVELMGLYCTR